jgi:ParB family chromosome partitioning protein
MENPRMAKEATAVLLLGGCPGASISLKAHEALRDLAKLPGSSNAYELVDTCAQKLLGKLGLRTETKDGPPSWAQLHHAAGDWTQVISGIRSLDGVELDALIALLVIVCLGTEQMERAEPEDTFFSGLAKDLALDMRKVWTPDEVFLSGLQRDDLLKVAADCGASRKHAGLANAKKKELVATLASYFKRTADPKASLDEHDAKGRAWLPDCMRVTPTKPKAASATGG